MNLQVLVGSSRARVLEAGRWFVVLCLFSVPINKPATNIFLGLALLCALLGAATRERFRNAARHPVALGAAVWFLILLASVAFEPPQSDSWQALGVYKALLYPMIVMSLIDTPQWRKRALLAFGLPACLILFASWLQFAIALTFGDASELDHAVSFTVFKNYTQQGIEFLVLAALAASWARVEQDRRYRFKLWIIAGAALINVIFVLQSRTAYLIVPPLLLYWFWQSVAGGAQRWRRAGAAGLVLVAIGAAALSAPRVQQRLSQVREDVQLYSTEQSVTSTGIRFELWKRTIPIIEAAPWFGHGLGQWQNQFNAAVKQAGDVDPRLVMGHPHQEALLILSEQGIVGMGIMIAMIVLLVRYIRRLDLPDRDFYSCLVIIYLTSGLTNCILVDFSHRHVIFMLLSLIPLAATSAKPRLEPKQAEPA